jgi:hypothetical protein
MPQKKKFDRRIPPCPDPDKYILVKGKYRYFWRLKRGTIIPATLNDVLTRSAQLTKPANNAAKQLLTMLAVFTQRMELTQLPVRIAGAFKKSALKTGKMNFSCLQDMEFQEDYPLQKLWTGLVSKQINNGTLNLSVPVGKLHVIKHSKLATSYELHAILIFGDPSKERGMRIDVERSREYTFTEKGEVDCSFSLVLPPKNRPWMVLLHIGCKFNVSIQPGPKYFGMKVVMVGGG